MNKYSILTLLLILSTLMATAQNKIYMTANGQRRTVTLCDNPATTALTELLKEGDIMVRMNDYGGFEKVGTLPQSLPTSDSQITTGPGDIMLYQGNQIVIFYGTNSWSYTPIGKIDNATADNIKAFLGGGSVELTISFNDNTGVEKIIVDENTEEDVFDLNGRPVLKRPLTPGFYIVNNKKIIIR